MKRTLWLLLYLTGAFAATLWLFDNAMDRRGAADLRHALSQISPYRWTFDAEGAISDHGRGDIDEPRFRNGAALLTARGDDPRLWIENRRLLDLRGYPLLSLDIHAEQGDRLQIHLSCATHPLFVTTHTLPPVAISAGANQLLIRLDQGRMHAFTGGPCPAAAFDGIRIDPGMTPGNRFTLDGIELLPEPSAAVDAPPMRMDYHQAMQRQTLPHFTESGRHLIIENVSTLAPPEWNRARAEALYLRNPSLILFSGPLPTRAEELLDGTRSATPRPPVAHAAAGWLSSMMLFCLTIITLSIAGLWRGQRILGHGRMVVRHLLDRPRIQLALVITASLLVFQIIPYSVTSMPLLILDAIAFLALVMLLLMRGAPPALPAGHWRWFPRTVDGWRDVALWTAALIGVLLIIAAIASPPGWPDPISLAIHATRYTLWALLQQLILGPLLIDRLHAVNGDKARSIVIGAIIFSAFHFPNFALICVTLVAGLIWGRLYLRYHALLPLALSHGVLGALFEHLLPGYLRWSGKVGVGYFQAMGF